VNEYSFTLAFFDGNSKYVLITKGPVYRNWKGTLLVKPVLQA